MLASGEVYSRLWSSGLRINYFQYTRAEQERVLLWIQTSVTTNDVIKLFLYFCLCIRKRSGRHDYCADCTCCLCMAAYKHHDLLKRRPGLLRCLQQLQTLTQQDMPIHHLQAQMFFGALGDTSQKKQAPVLPPLRIAEWLSDLNQDRMNELTMFSLTTDSCSLNKSNSSVCHFLSWDK